MSLHRRAAKRDANEPAIVSALEALGCVVWRVSGKGLPDLIVLRAGKKWLADVKAAKKGVTEPQAELWEEAATKARCAVFILRTPEDAAAMLSNALQPWEPTRPKARANDVTAHERRQTTGSCTCGSRGRPVKRHHGTGCPDHPNPPRKGDAAKARGEGRKRLTHREVCRFNDCETGERCGTFPAIGPGYTPPRSKPVAHNPDCEQVYHKDTREPCTCGALAAAKEAEATFAPPPFQHHSRCTYEGGGLCSCPAGWKG